MTRIHNRLWFDVLSALAEDVVTLSEHQVPKLRGYPTDTIKRVMEELVEAGLAYDGAVTAEGLEALEPYRAKRAIFIAAGFGTRLIPVSLNTPKPLVRVHGKRLIDGLIDACIDAGIEEIYIVRGYLAEQFDQLLYKYPTLKFLENPVYNEANNISSAMCARHLLKNAYVFEADLLIRNPSIVTKYHYTSDFLGIPKKRSDDWCFTVENGIIQEQKIGGTDCYQAIGISYWDAWAGNMLGKHIEQAYERPGGKEKYWDQVPFMDFPEHYRIEIRECTEEDIVEIDTFSELKAIDKSYDTKI